MLAMADVNLDNTESMKKGFLFFAYLFLLSCLGQITSDIYLPALPAIQASLRTTTHMAQMSLALFMYGFAFSHLIFGPLSDSLGRKRPLMYGTVVAIAASILCQLTTSIDWFLVGRILQGIGVGASAALFRSILRDVYSGNKLAKVGSFLSISRVVLLACAPLIGGYLLHFFGWRSCFIFLEIYAGICLLATVWILPETNRYQHLHKSNIISVAKNTWTVLKNPIFVGYSFCNLAAFGGIAAWLTSLPFILQEVVGLSPVEFGWVAALAGLFFIIGGLINAILVERFGLSIMLKVGLAIMFIAGAIMLAFGLDGKINVVVIMVPVIIYIIGSSMVFSNSYAGAFHPFPKIAGTAGAVFGFLQILGGAIGSMLMSYAKAYNQIPLSIVLLGTSLMAFLVVLFCAKKGDDYHYSDKTV